MKNCNPVHISASRLSILVIWVSILSGALIGPGCGPHQEANLTSALDSLFAETYGGTGAGGSVLITQADTVVYKASFGYADIPNRIHFTARTVSNLGSISKTFVAYGILLLRDQGKLSLEDSLLKYFPDFKNPELAGRVKIRHLLTHTSGLPDSRPVDRDSVFYLTANDEQNFAPLKGSYVLEFPPGTRWNYSNPSFNGLALIIEKVSGMKWQEFITKNIFTPAGMRDSKITDGEYPSEAVAHGYRKIDGKDTEYDFGEYPTFCAAGNGGVWSSIDNLYKYYLAMKHASFIAESTIAFSQTLWHPPAWSDSIPPKNGFSWFVSEPGPQSPYRRIFHTGHQAGFIAYFEMVPEKDLLVIIELNSETDMDVEEVFSLLHRFGQL